MPAKVVPSDTSISYFLLSHPEDNLKDYDILVELGSCFFLFVFVFPKFVISNSNIALTKAIVEIWYHERGKGYRTGGGRVLLSFDQR